MLPFSAAVLPWAPGRTPRPGCSLSCSFSGLLPTSGAWPSSTATNTGRHRCPCCLLSAAPAVLLPGFCSTARGSGLAGLLLALDPTVNGWYLAVAFPLTAYLCQRNLRLLRRPTSQNARAMFLASNIYLMVLLLALIFATFLSVPV